MNKVELLAPAGSFEAMKAAINNGANAVYLGGKNFSARAFANNFDEEQLTEAVKYAHLRNVKVYVTLNTLLNEFEIDNAIKMAEFYYSINVDALLVQDLGLFYVLKEKHPDFELHCSTQMHVDNIEGVKTAKALGFKRVVVPRESSLEFIKEVCKCGIEIETFVHGAICVSYSGQCLMSSVTKNRSANKGMCAQCCRLKYDLLDSNENKINTNTAYLLSPKDMCLVDDIPSLIKAGVSSFKIEGRMKSPAYVGYVTSIYRKAIDSYYQHRNYKLSNTELNNLKVLFNRNFTNDYLYQKADLFGQKTPNHLGVKIGETVGYLNGKTLVKLSAPLHQFDGIRINDFGCIVNKLYKNDYLVNSAEVNEIVEIETDRKLNGEVFKTLDYKLEKEINEREELKQRLDIEVEIIPDQTVKVRAVNYDFTYFSDVIAQTSINSPLNEESIIKQFSKLNETIYYLDNYSVTTNNAFLPVKVLNEIRRNFIDELNKFRLDSFKRKIIKNTVKFNNINITDFNDELIEKDDYINDYQINYVINPDSKYVENDKAVISEFGGLLKDYKHKLAYYTLNCSNSYTYEFLNRLNFERIILSSELTNEQALALIEGFKKRNNATIKPYGFTKGNKALMYIKSNPFKNYQNYEYLSDGINDYSIKHKNNIIELTINEDKMFDDNILTFKKLD